MTKQRMLTARVSRESKSLRLPAAVGSQKV